MRPLASVTGTRWDAMYAAFEFELGEDAGAVHLQRGVLDAAEIASERSMTSVFQPLKLTIALIHFEQIGGKQRRLIAARACADFHNGRR